MKQLSKKGMISDFREKHPKAAKRIVTGVAVIAGMAVVVPVGYIMFKEPKLGNLNWRAHFNRCGKAKIGYSSIERANFQTLKDFATQKGHPWMPAYVCPLCEKFHVGHKH